MRNDLGSILRHFEPCHGQANLVHFQVSSIIKCYRRHKIDQLHSITFDHAVVKLEKKCHKTFEIHLPAAEQARWKQFRVGQAKMF